MDNKYSVERMAFDLRRFYLEKQLIDPLLLGQKSDNQVVLDFLMAQPSDVRESVIRKMDSYSPDYSAALKQIDWATGLATAGQAQQGYGVQKWVTLDQYLENVDAGIYPVTPEKLPETDKESLESMWGEAGVPPKGSRVKTQSHGLFQINNFFQNEEQQKQVWGKFVPPSNMTPEENIEYASKLQKKEGWKRWTTHREGLHEPYLGMTNEQIASTYKIDKKYLDHIDSTFGNESDTAKAVMIAESSGLIDSMETVDIIPPTGMTSEDSSNYKLPNGKKINKDLADLLGLDIKIMDEASVDDSTRHSLNIKEANDTEATLKSDGQVFSDNIYFNDTSIKDTFKIGLGLTDEYNVENMGAQDALSPKNIKVKTPASVQLDQLYNDPNWVKSAGEWFGKDWSYEGLKNYKKAVRLEMDKAIEEDPDLLARALYLQDRMESGKFLPTIRDMFTDSEMRALGLDLTIQSLPSIVGTILGTANLATAKIKPPMVTAGIQAVVNSWMFTQQAGGAFDEIMGELMEKEVKDGAMTEAEAFDLAYATWVSVGAVNTAIEHFRMHSIARGINIALPKSKVAQAFWGKFKKVPGKELAATIASSKLGRIVSPMFNQALQEGTEEVFQGMNERFTVNAQLGTIRPDQPLWKGVWNEGEASMEFLGGATGGFFFGLGGSVSRTYSEFFKKSSLEKEINESTDQEIKKLNGKNYNQGASDGAAAQKEALTDDYFDNLTYEGALESIVSTENPIDYSGFKGKTGHDNLVVKLLAQGANARTSSGRIILNLLKNSPDGMAVLDKLDKTTKGLVMTLARSRVKELIPALAVEYDSSNASQLNDKLDEMIALIVSGDLKLKTQKNILSKSVEGDKYKRQGRVLGSTKKGKSFVDSMINELMDVKSTIINSTATTEEQAQNQIEMIQNEIINSFLDFDIKKEVQEEIKKKKKKQNLSKERTDSEIERESHKVSKETRDSINQQKEKKPTKEYYTGLYKSMLSDFSEEKVFDNIARKSATELNKIIKEFGLEGRIKKNAEALGITLTKDGEINFANKNKKGLAKAILSHAKDLKNDEKTPLKTTEYKGDPSKLKRAGEMSKEDWASFLGDLTGVEKEIKEDTEDDVDRVKEEQSTSTMYDDAMNDNTSGGDALLEEIHRRAGKNKSKSTQLEREFKNLSPLAQALVPLMGANDSNIENFRGLLEQLYRSSMSEAGESEAETEASMHHNIDRLIRAIKAKYGSEQNFLDKIRTVHEGYKQSSDDVKNHFMNAAMEILKGFGAMLSNEDSLNKFSANPIPDPDFAKASQHFEKAWNEFKDGYKGLGLSEGQLFARFYHGVLKQLKKLRNALANPRILEKWFKRWGRGHEFGTRANLIKRRFFTAGTDVAGFGQAADKAIDKDIKQVALTVVDMLDYQNQEGIGNSFPDTDDDRTAQQDRFGENGLIKAAISMKNLLEESLGQRIDQVEFNNIKNEVLFHGKRTWEKDDKGDYLETASGELMDVTEYYEYLEIRYNVNTTDEQNYRNFNIVNSYYNMIFNYMPRYQRKEFVLVNIEKTDSGKETLLEDTGDKRIHTKTDVNLIDGKPLPDNVVANFLEKQMPGRVATLSKSDILRVWSRKKYRKTERGAYKNDDPNELDIEKLFFRQDDFFSFSFQELNSLDTELAVDFKKLSLQGPAFLLASKGGKAQSIVVGISEELDVKIGRDEAFTDTFFDMEVEKGNITQVQADGMKKDINSLRGESDEQAIAALARYRYIQAAHGTKSMSSEIDPLTGKPYGHSLKAHFKRFANEFADGTDRGIAPDATWVRFDYQNVYGVSNITGKIIPLENSEGKYIWDGNIPSSSEFLEQTAIVIGRMPEEVDNLPGWIKMFHRKMSSDHEDYIQLKGLNTLSPDITVYQFSDESKTPNPRQDEVVFKSFWRENRMVMEAGDGTPLAFAASNEEAKMMQGEYAIPNKPQSLSADQSRVLQNANFTSKGNGTSPFQWFDQLQELATVNPTLKPLLEKIQKQLRKDQKVYFRWLKEFRENPQNLAVYLKAVNQNMTIDKSELLKMIDNLDPESMDLLKHSHNSGPIVNFLKNRFIVDGAFSGRIKSGMNVDDQFADYVHVVPDWHGLVEDWEYGATPFNPVWKVVVREYLFGAAPQEKEEWHGLSKTVEGRRKQVDTINAFLKTPTWKKLKDKGWQQLFRSPIQHFTNPHMLRIGHFLYRDYGDVMFVSPNMMDKMELDFDGDAVTSRKWTNDIQQDLINLQWAEKEDGGYEYSDAFNALKYIIPLPKFKQSAVAYTPTSGQILKEIEANFETGNQMAMVQNTRTYRSMFTHKGLSIKWTGAHDGEYTLVPRPIDEKVLLWYAPLDDEVTQEELEPGDVLVEINGEKYIETTSDRELAIIQQAAFDESKLALLADWWKEINGSPSSIGEINRFLNFSRSRAFKMVDSKGNEVQDGNAQGAALLRTVIQHFKVSELRQGKDSNHKFMGADQLIKESGIVYERINSTAEEQKIGLRALTPAPQRAPSLIDQLLYGPRKPVTPWKIIDAEFEEIKNKPVTTYLEDTVSMAFGHMIDLGLVQSVSELSSETGVSNFLQPNKNQQMNANYMAMMEIVGGKEVGGGAKLQTILTDYNISDTDVSVGLLFASKMNKEYMMMRQIRDKYNKLVSQLSYTTAQIEYDTSLIAFGDKWAPEWRKLSPGAQFVSTLAYFSGTSTMDSMIPASRLLTFGQQNREFQAVKSQIKHLDYVAPSHVKLHESMVEKMKELSKKTNVNLLEEGRYGLQKSARGLIHSDFKNISEYEQFVRDKKNLDAQYLELVNLADAKNTLELKQKRMWEELNTESKTINWKTSVQDDRRRAISQLLPSDLMSKDFLRLYGKTWGEMVDDAPPSKPKVGKQIKLATFQDLGYKKLEEKGKCKLK